MFRKVNSAFVQWYWHRKFFEHVQLLCIQVSWPLAYLIHSLSYQLPECMNISLTIAHMVIIHFIIVQKTYDEVSNSNKRSTIVYNNKEIIM